MKRKSILLIVCALLVLLFTACEQAHEHDFGSWKETREATCEKEGKETRKCDCGETETRKTDKLEHSYEVTETPATCQEAGVKTYRCENCDDSYEEPLAQQGFSSTEIYDMYLGSVGEVITYDRNGSELSLGSCFVYSDDGQLVTNYHVIEDAYSAEVTFRDTTYKIKKVLAYDKEIDVAVLQISANDLVPAMLCEHVHSVGSVVYAFGNSRGLTSTFSDGMITYSDRELDGIHYVQHDAPISGGNSGGPLINIYGEVIGINTWTVRDSQNLNFAISISELSKLDYSDPLTMAELYDKESNAYKKIANYVMTYGSPDEGHYYLELDYFYSSDYSSRYSIFAMYYPDDAEVLLCFADDADYCIYFSLQEDISGSYSWAYWDKDDYQMYGKLYAPTYSESTRLSYTNHNISYSSLRSALQNLASTMMHVLCSSLNDCFADIGVTAADLGFLNY